MANSFGGLGLTQDRRFSSRPIPIAGRRLFSATFGQALPPALKIGTTAPTGYDDHGSVLLGKVDVSVEITKQSIDLGRIPTPHRFYIESQRGTFKATLQEYEPEIISLAAGQDGVPTTAAGYSQVYIGGALGSVRRFLVIDDFDVDNTNDSFPWDEYWWTTSNGQLGGTFALGEDKAATTIPIEVELLAMSISGVNRLLEFRAIDAAA
jgi:hypothetical protein